MKETKINNNMKHKVKKLNREETKEGKVKKDGGIRRKYKAMTKWKLKLRKHFAKNRSTSYCHYSCSIVDLLRRL